MIATRRKIAFWIVALTLSASAGFAQTSIAVVSSFSLGQTKLKGLSYSIQISIAYPGGLTASSYVSASQLNMDFKGFVAGYPDLQDPPEAILSSVAGSILNKYSQMAGVSVLGSNVTVPAGGGATPGTPPATPQTNTIIVYQGTLPTPGVTGGVFADRHVAPKPPADR